MEAHEDKREKTELEDLETEDLFDEMSVVELEERLELLGRCVCRNRPE